MRIVIASDHGGYEYKQKFIEHLNKSNVHDVLDIGPFDDASVDYPDYAHKLCTYIPKDADMGCLLYTSPSPRDKRQSRMPSSA